MLIFIGFLLVQRFLIFHCFVQVPGFRQFMVERFAAECCIYKLVEPSFNFRDANTVSCLFPSLYV